jgi:predicted transcriptional regulator
MSLKLITYTLSDTFESFMRLTSAYKKLADANSTIDPLRLLDEEIKQNINQLHYRLSPEIFSKTMAVNTKLVSYFEKNVSVKNLMADSSMVFALNSDNKLQRIEKNKLRQLSDWKLYFYK